MPNPKLTPNKKNNGQASKLHRWRNMPPEDPLMQELETKLREFEDSITVLRGKIAKKYKVIWHSPYFTRDIPG